MCGVRYKTVHLCNNLQSYYLSWLSHKQLDCVTVHNGVEMLVSQQDSGNKLDVGGGPSKVRWEMAYGDMNMTHREVIINVRMFGRVFGVSGQHFISNI